MYYGYFEPEKQEGLEKEREGTMVNPQYQKWVREFNVGREWVDPTGRLKAKELNSQYNYSNPIGANRILNILGLKGIW